MTTFRMTPTTSAKRELITGGDPDARYAIPEEGQFWDGEHGAWLDFLPDAHLDKIGAALISRKLTNLDDGELTVDYRWKRRGGSSKGNANLGNCVRLTGAAKMYSQSTKVLVTLSADHLETQRYKNWQVEALIYHELLKVCPEDRWSKPDKLTGKLTKLPTIYHVQGPDFSGFYKEIEEYGLWHEPLAKLAEIIQPGLPGFAESYK